MDPIAPPIPLDELLDHRAWVRALARSLVRDAAAADDVEQDAWLAAMRRPPADRSTVRAWFATVVRNVARDHGRSAGRRERREAAVARDDAGASTADVVARAESHKRVVLAVMDLDEPYRTTVLLRFFEDLPPRDVAARMGCPVETVRTRVRRALALLRERLGGDGEDDGWRAAVLPLLAAPAADAPSPPRGDRKMLTIKIAAVAALLLATPAAFLLLSDPPVAAPAAPDTETAEAADTDAAGVPERVRVVPPPPAAPGDDEEIADEPPAPGEGVSFGQPVNPLPPHEDASVFADGRLAMRVSVEPPHPRAGQPFHLVVTFRNDGTGPLRFHVPEFAGSVPFPQLELRSADDVIRMPVAAPFQSMWTHGVQGAIVRLEPGEEHAVKTYVADVAEVDPDPAARDPRRFALSQQRQDLPPGDYTVTALLAKERPVVPWGEESFAASEKEVPGLWTGELRSTPIAFRLAPPDEPLLTLRAPERLVPGEDLVMTLTVENPSQEDRELPGAFALRRSEKGGPSYVAWFALADVAAPAAPDPSRTLTLAAGETRTCRLDLGALTWEPTGRRRDLLRRAPWPFDRTYPALWVTCGERDEEGNGMIGSNTVFQAIHAAPDLSGTGLSLRVGAEGLTAVEPFVTVVLRNDGSQPVAIPARLRSPRALALSARPDGEKARPVAIRVVEAEPAGLLAPEDVLVLQPGESHAARVAVATDWAAALEPGRHRLQASWVNVDACAREGFDVRPVVGTVTGEPVEIDVPAR